VWLLNKLMILDLANIIRAAIIMLNKIRVEDIVSMDENDEIDILIECSCSMLIIVRKVKINSDDIVTHQYELQLDMSISIMIGVRIFSIY